MRNLQELPKLRDSLTYLYFEHGRIEQEQLSVAFVDKNKQVTPIPAASLSVLMLGPGTTITHAGVKTLVDNGCLILWVGEDNTRMYAQGSGETRKAYHLLRQAELAGDPDKRLEVVRRMYEIRFAEPIDPTATLQQIRGLEGARVRTAYARLGRRTGVIWHGRNYDRQDWNNADPINQAISTANGLLNGLCHAAIVSGGYSPALGFIHTGKQMSFVYDIADLYKIDVTVPIAFEVVAKGKHNLRQRVRQACREAFKEHKLLQRILPDIDRLLEAENLPSDGEPDPDLDPAAPAPLWDVPVDEKGYPR